MQMEIEYLDAQMSSRSTFVGKFTGLGEKIIKFLREKSCIIMQRLRSGDMQSTPELLL